MTVLDQILKKVERRIRELDTEDLAPSPHAGSRSLEEAVTSTDGVSIIAEIKPSSPSAGRLGPSDPESVAERAASYEKGGACAVSVLTEPEFFDGSPKLVRVVKETVDLPVLRKDFIVHRVQIEESAHYEADAILLIAEVVEEDAPELVDTAHEHGLEVLLEFHDPSNIRYVVEANPDLVGVNSRDLRTLDVNVDRIPELAEKVGKELPGTPVVGESGVTGPEDVKALRDVVDAVLVGTHLMKAEDPERAVRELVKAGSGRG